MPGQGQRCSWISWCKETINHAKFNDFQVISVGVQEGADLEQILLWWRWELNWILGRGLGVGHFPNPCMNREYSEHHQGFERRQREKQRCWCGSQHSWLERDLSQPRLRDTKHWERSGSVGSDMGMLRASPPRDQNNCQICIYFLWRWFFRSWVLHFGPLLNCNSLRSDQQPSSNWNHFLLSSESLRRRTKSRRRTQKMKLCTSAARGNRCHITSHRWPGWGRCGPCVSQALPLHTWAGIAACFAWKPRLPKRKGGRIYGKQKRREK